MNRRGRIGLPLLVLGLGCGVAPRHFRDLIDAAPMTRARAAHLGDAVPAAVAIPALIDRLEDDDPVVRLSAHEALRRRTGEQFGFLPWADPPERARAVARWRSWWTGRQATLARSGSIP
jgi:HEAT repeat protein